MIDRTHGSGPLYRIGYRFLHFGEIPLAGRGRRPFSGQTPPAP